MPHSLSLQSSGSSSSCCRVITLICGGWLAIQSRFALFCRRSNSPQFSTSLRAISLQILASFKYEKIAYLTDLLPSSTQVLHLVHVALPNFAGMNTGFPQTSQGRVLPSLVMGEQSLHMADLVRPAYLTDNWTGLPQTRQGSVLPLRPLGAGLGGSQLPSIVGPSLQKRTHQRQKLLNQLRAITWNGFTSGPKKNLLFTK